MTPTSIVYEIVDTINPKVWDTYVSHPLQSYAWGEFRKAMGITVVRLTGKKNNAIFTCFQLTFHRIPKTNWTIGYFPKGPAPDIHMIKILREIGHKQKAISIQLEPLDLYSLSKIEAYSMIHLLPASRPLFTPHTFVIDLKPPEEKLLQSFHSKTRYNIKVAQKHDVKIREDNSDAAFASYLKLTDETTKRQQFYAHSHTYHTNMWYTMKENNIAHLFTATYQNKLLAAWIVFVWKNCMYYPYGSSSRENREVMAPTLLLWELIRYGKSVGCTSFDLWGALSENPDPKDPWYGFHRFKLGFSPTLVRYVGSFDLVLSPVLYRLYALANTIRWAFLQMKLKF